AASPLPPMMWAQPVRRIRTSATPAIFFRRNSSRRASGAFGIGGLGGQKHAKSRSLPDDAVCTDRASIGLGYLLRDGQSEAGSDRLRLRLVLHLVVLLEDPRELIAGDADPRVRDLYDHPRAVPPSRLRAQRDPAVARRELEGV